MLSLFSEGNEDLKGTATQLAVLLSTEGKKERNAWEKLHGKFAEIATSIADPKMSVQALLSNLNQELGPLRLGLPDAHGLLREIIELVEEKVSTHDADGSKAIPLLKNMVLLVADQLNMIPLRNSTHVEMIDGATKFSEKNVHEMVTSSIELSATNAPYSVVSIVGAQSSGKSYLLNHLFGTVFPVMEFEETGMKQTTQGILLTRCIEPSLLVLDVEGFDGRERGEDKSFEKKAALFALTVSDLMMVNISVFNIGRQDGGSMGLFKTIFQERTKLDPGLTKILVIIRNCNQETRNSLEHLRKDLMKTLEEVWVSVNTEPASFRRYIEINVFGLPEKDSEDFQKEVTKLRKHISSSSNRSSKVPAQSFAFISQSLWNAITQNDKLDVPSHMVLLAKSYCQQAAEDCIKQFLDKDEELLKLEESPQGFKEMSDTILVSIITKYNEGTELYDAGVRDKERQEMVDNIKKIFTKHSRELIKKIKENTSKHFKVECVKNLENMKEIDGVVVYDESIVESCTEQFKKLCEELKVFDMDYYHDICGQLKQQLTLHTANHISLLKEDQARKALEKAQENAQRERESREEEIKRERESREEEIKRERESREEEKKREKELRKEKKKRDKELQEQDELKKKLEDLERRGKALDNTDSQRDQFRIIQSEVARQIQQGNAPAGASFSIFSLK